MEVAVKRRNKAEQLAIIEEWESSGEAMADFCSKRGINLQSLARWARAHGGQRQEDREAGIFLPVSLAPKGEPEREDPCRILIGKGLSLECTSRTHHKALETALAAAAQLCGLI